MAEELKLLSVTAEKKLLKTAFQLLDLNNVRVLLDPARPTKVDRKTLHVIFRSCASREQREFIWSLRDLIQLTGRPVILSIPELYEIALLHPEFRPECEKHIRERLVDSYHTEEYTVKLAMKGEAKLLMDIADRGHISNSAAKVTGTVASLTIRVTASLPGITMEDILPFCAMKNFWAEALVGAVLGSNDNIAKRAKEEIRREIDKLAR